MYPAASITANGLSCTICKHFACSSFWSTGLTSYFLATNVRPHARPPDLLMSSTTASTIWWRSGRIWNAALPAGPAMLTIETSTSTSLAVMPGALFCRPEQPDGAATPDDDGPPVPDGALPPPPVPPVPLALAWLAP